jgi:FANCL UBC-like domain 2
MAKKRADIPTEFWREIVSSLESIGYSHLSSVDESNLGLIQLKVESNAGTHFLDLNVESAILIKCQCGDLPEKAVSVITQQAS